MNRKRKATGINSYEKDIQFHPISFLASRIKQENIHWLDLCCGEGNALIEAAQYFQTKSEKPSIQLTGIDLVDYFGDTHGLHQQLTFKSLNLSEWIPQKKYDLINTIKFFNFIQKDTF